MQLNSMAPGGYFWYYA